MFLHILLGNTSLAKPPLQWFGFTPQKYQQISLLLGYVQEPLASQQSTANMCQPWFILWHPYSEWLYHDLQGRSVSMKDLLSGIHQSLMLPSLWNSVPTASLLFLCLSCRASIHPTGPETNYKYYENLSDKLILVICCHCIWYPVVPVFPFKVPG